MKIWMSVLLILTSAVLAAQSAVLWDLKTGLPPDSSFLLTGPGHQGREIKLEKPVGAIAFTVTPLDWDSGSKDDVVFFRVGDAIFYRRAYADFLIAAKDGEQRLHPIKLPSDGNIWQKDVSRNVVVNFEEGKSISLFIDGEPAAQYVGKTPFDFTQLMIATGKRDKGWGLGGKSRFDDFRVYERPLSLPEIALFGNRAVRMAAPAQAGSEEVQSVFPFGLCSSPPVADGRIGDGEYPVALSGLLAVANNNLLSPNAARMYSGYDEQFLYFAVDFSFPANYQPQSAAENKDSEKLISGGDLFCLLLRDDTDTANRHFKSYYLTVAPNGVYFDALEEVDWAKVHLYKRDAGVDFVEKVASSVEQGRWVVEVKIPRSKVQLDGRDRFLLSFGMSLNKQQYTWQPYQYWFDYDTAYGLAVLTEAGFDFSPGSLPTGRADMTLQWRNPGKNAVPSEFAAKLSPMKVEQVVKQAVDDVVTEVELVKRLGTPLLDWRESTEVAPGAGRNFQKNLTVKDDNALYIINTEAKWGGQTIFRREMPFLVQPPLQLIMMPFPKTDELQLEFRVAAGTPQPEDSLTLEFLDENGKKAATKKQAWSEIERGKKLKINDLPAGTYQVSYRLDRKGAEPLTGEVTYVKQPLPEWLKQPRAMEALSPDYAPQPWGAIQVRGEKINAAGKEFEFGGPGMFKQLTIQGKPLFTVPPTLEFRRGDKTETIGFTDALITSQHAGRVGFQLRGETPEFEASADGVIEFDGLVRFRLKVIPKNNGCQVDNLSLRYQLADAQFFNTLDPKVDSQWGEVCDLQLMAPHYLWIGSDFRGLNWVTENYKGWKVDSRRPRAAIADRGDGAEVSLFLVNKPTQVTTPVDCEMAFHPTPVRNNDRLKWLGVRPICMGAWTPAPCNLTMIHPNQYGDNGSISYPIRNRKLREDYQDIKKNNPGQQLLPYMVPHMVHTEQRVRPEKRIIFSRQPEDYLLSTSAFYDYPKNPVAEYFKYEWRVMPEQYYPGGSKNSPMLYCSPAGSWSDYLTDAIYQMFTVDGMDGIYFDLAGARRNGDASKGYTYRTDDGKTEDTLEIFALRDLYKRLHRVSEEVFGNDGKPHLILHGDPVITPLSVFGDLLLTAEHLKVQKPFDYTAWMMASRLISKPPKLIPVEQKENSYNTPSGRVLLSERIWGVPVIFLPQYGYLGKLGSDPAVARETLGLGFLHGSVVAFNLIDRRTVNQFYFALSGNFDLDNAEFHPYWDNNMSTSEPAVKVSYYKIKDREDYLLFIHNLSGKAHNVTMTLPQPLHNAGMLYDLDNPTYRYSMDQFKDREWTLPVKPYDFRMIRISLP
jgi:hypothetical protein